MAGFTATGVGGLGQSEGFDRPRLIAEGRDGPVRAALGRSACPERRAPAMGLTKELLGFESKVNLRDGIEKTWIWYREQVFKSNRPTAR